MEKKQLSFKAGLALAFTIFVLSPADDIILSSLCGGAIFGFGSIPFYLVIAASSTISLILWVRRYRRKHNMPRLTPKNDVVAYNGKSPIN
jgi:hypothetical protein